jgi:hypothetical protein
MGDQPRVSIQYKADHRLKLVQITAGQVKFLVHMGIFESMARDVDHWEVPEGKTPISISNYQTLYRERLQ